MKRIVNKIVIISLVFTFSCEAQVKEKKIIEISKDLPYDSEPESLVPKDFYSNLADQALTLTEDDVVYDPTYFSIPYPNGDVPAGKGVCTDVVIRAYRKMDIDLQKEVHEDMKSNFSKYPKIWGLSRTDTNIDHRRVPNLQVFFTRKGKNLKLSQNAEDYKPGDLVTWKLGGRLPHIGIVSNIKNKEGSRYMIIHNIGGGQVLEDCLFNFEIDGHYRYEGN